jgi:hypothetical protein
LRRILFAVVAEREEVLMVVVTVAGSQVERDVDPPSVVRERLEAFAVEVLAEAMNRPGEPELAFELAVVELNHPPQPGEPRESLRLGAGGEVGDPVVGRCLGVFGPLDDQPFLAGCETVAGDRARGGDAGEPGGDPGLAGAAERDGLEVGVGERVGVLADRDRVAV